MSDIMSTISDGWNKNQTLLLIRELRKHPCLYNPADINFTNKKKRNEELNIIMGQLKTNKPNVTVQCIKNKIRTLQSQLCKVRTKLRKLKKNGLTDDDDDVYEPKLWCYKELSYLTQCSEDVCDTAKDELSTTTYIDCEIVKHEPSTLYVDPSDNSSSLMEYEILYAEDPIEIEPQNEKDELIDTSDQLQNNGLDVLQFAKKFVGQSPTKVRTTKEDNELIDITNQLQNNGLDSIQVAKKRVWKLPAKEPTTKEDERLTDISEQLQNKALDALQFAKKLLEQSPSPTKLPSSKEDEFCRYLLSELRKIQLDDTFDDLKLEILQLVRKKIKEEKQMLQE